MGQITQIATCQAGSSSLARRGTFSWAATTNYTFPADSFRRVNSQIALDTLWTWVDNFECSGRSDDFDMPMSVVIGLTPKELNFVSAWFGGEFSARIQQVGISRFFSLLDGLTGASRSEHSPMTPTCIIITGHSLAAGSKFSVALVQQVQNPFRNHGHDTKPEIEVNLSPTCSELITSRQGDSGSLVIKETCPTKSKVGKQVRPLPGSVSRIFDIINQERENAPVLVAEKVEKLTFQPNPDRKHSRGFRGKYRHQVNMSDEMLDWERAQIDNRHSKKRQNVMSGRKSQEKSAMKRFKTRGTSNQGFVSEKKRVLEYGVKLRDRISDKSEVASKRAQFARQRRIETGLEYANKSKRSRQLQKSGMLHPQRTAPSIPWKTKTRIDEAARILSYYKRTGKSPNVSLEKLQSLNTSGLNKRAWTKFIQFVTTQSGTVELHPGMSESSEISMADTLGIARYHSDTLSSSSLAGDCNYSGRYINGIFKRYSGKKVSTCPSCECVLKNINGGKRGKHPGDRKDLSPELLPLLRKPKIADSSSTKSQLSSAGSESCTLKTEPSPELPPPELTPAQLPCLDGVRLNFADLKDFTRFLNPAWYGFVEWFGSIVDPPSVDTSIRDYDGERRIVTNRNVKEIKQNFRLDTIRLPSLCFRKVRFFLGLSLILFYFLSFSSMILMMPSFEHRMSPLNFNFGAKSWFFSLRSGFYHCIIAFAICSAATVYWAFKCTFFSSKTLSYVPHLVSCLLFEFDRVDNKTTVITNIRSKSRRLACFPLQDHEHMRLIEGSEQVVMFLLARSGFHPAWSL